MRLKDKIALVSGAARGMGYEIAELFAREGAVTYAGDIAPPDRAHAAGVESIRLDVTSEEDWAGTVDTILGRHGRIDILVNNAGIIAYEPLDELDLAAWQQVIAVNQTGVFLGMRAVVPAMRRQKSGSMVNFSSIWGNAAVGGAPAYHPTKGAVRNMTKNAAMSYVADGIRVNSVHPGFIDTPLTQAQAADINAFVIAATPMKRASKPIEVANGVLFLASDESSYMTGAELVIDGGYLAQ
jgi:NAD(P)-dependent dehydrogenase (short-subunit alcohol dehydrogenase family)